MVVRGDWDIRMRRALAQRRVLERVSTSRIASELTRHRARETSVVIVSRCRSGMIAGCGIVLRQILTRRRRERFFVVISTRRWAILITSKRGWGDLWKSGHDSKTSWEKGRWEMGERERQDDFFLGRLGLCCVGSIRLSYRVDCHACRKWFWSFWGYLFDVFKDVCLDYIQSSLLYHKILFVLSVYEERKWGHCYDWKNWLYTYNHQRRITLVSTY